jgi:hypothetical protein
MKGFWSVVRSWLRPHRGLSQERLSLCLGFVEFVHKVGKWGKALLGVLIERLVSSDPGIQYERFFYLVRSRYGGVMVTVATALVDCHIQLITVKQERQGAQRYGTLLYGSDYTSPPHYFGVPVVSASTPDEVHAAIAQGLASDGPLIVEAWGEPSEYDAVILRPHKCRNSRQPPARLM